MLRKVLKSKLNGGNLVRGVQAWAVYTPVKILSSIC